MNTSPTIPCQLCGKPTAMLGTKRCDPCYELERRIKANPDLAQTILSRIRMEEKKCLKES